MMETPAVRLALGSMWGPAGCLCLKEGSESHMWHSDGGNPATTQTQRVGIRSLSKPTPCVGTRACLCTHSWAPALAVSSHQGLLLAFRFTERWLPLLGAYSSLNHTLPAGSWTVSLWRWIKTHRERILAHARVKSCLNPH